MHNQRRGFPRQKTNDMKTINNVDDLSDDLCLYCPLDDDEKGTPGVINKYAPGEFYAVTESDIWLMRYHKIYCLP